MNHPVTATRPRLICRVVRRWSVFSHVAAGSTHATSCAACREYFSACAQLEAGLRREAAQLAPEFPAGLEQRIERTVRAESSTATPATGRRIDFALVRRLGLAATAVALAVIGFRVSPWSDPEPGEAAIAKELVGLLGTAESFSDRWWNEMLPAAGVAVQDNALRQELDGVVVGARNALDFLALNFLPTAAPPTEAPEAGPPPARGRI